MDIFAAINEPLNYVCTIVLVAKNKKGKTLIERLLRNIGRNNR